MMFLLLSISKFKRVKNDINLLSSDLFVVKNEVSKTIDVSL